METNNIKTGIELIVDERQRQIDVEGYSQQHDFHHRPSDFIDAALAYVESAKIGVVSKESGNNDEELIMYRKATFGAAFFPRGWHFKPSTDIRDLVKAGALIAAAIDRLQMDTK